VMRSCDVDCNQPVRVRGWYPATALGVRDARGPRRPALVQTIGRVGWGREVKVWVGLGWVSRVEYNRIRKGRVG